MNVAPQAAGAIPIIRVPNRRVRIRLVGSCPHCTGSMFDLDIPPVDLDRPHVSARGAVVCMLCARTVASLEIGGGLEMTPERFRALPIETRRAPTADEPLTRPCPDCGIRQTRTRNERCRECWTRLQWRQSHAARLVEMLQDGMPRSRSELCEALALDTDGLRQIINNARIAGFAIARRGWQNAEYRLEGVAP